VDGIHELWRRVEAAMAVHAPDDLKRLTPGASDEALVRVEGVLGLTLPPDVRTSYQLHDGGYTVQLVSSMMILPLGKIVEWWRTLEELLHDEDWANQPPYYFSEEVVASGWQVGSVQPVWWHRRWIPLGSDNGGNLCCLDMAPAPGGTDGQIIDWDHECGPSRVLYPGFHQLLSALADHIESGAGTQTDRIGL
jgi:cell wall assembly regulator SMI1